jgi:hypothetical protein
MEMSNLVAETTQENMKESRSSRKSKVELHQPSTSFADRVQFLQRTIGNQSVERMIRSGTLQAKLRIGQPGDVYEKEADSVADRVIQMPEPQKGSANNFHIQRACPGCEETELNRQPIKEEDEEKKLQRQPIKEEDEEKKLQIQPEEEEEKNVQAKGDSSSSPEAHPNLENQIHSMKGGGQPLSEGERSFFEPRFGADFSQVRVHTDSNAADSAKSVNAQAYTVGRDIVFGNDKYFPGSPDGKKLLAHELTHIIQQNGEK